MVEQRIHKRFEESADLKYRCARSLSHPVARAAQTLLDCVTGGGKVLVCGNGASAALSQYMTALLVGGLQRPRPELPALALTADAATLTAVARRGEYADAFAAQVRALGAAGDVLLVLSTNGNASNLLQAAQAAQDREMPVIALTGQGGGALAGVLTEADVLVDVPEKDTARIHELHQLTLHVLCEHLDLQLLGEAPPPESAAPDPDPAPQA